MLKLAKELNSDESVHGIIIQQPVVLEKPINNAHVYSIIKPWKDVDGLNPVNVGLLGTLNAKPYFVPCTANAVLHLLRHHQIQIEGKRVCIIGRSAIVGMPLFNLMMRNDATVTVCHSKTENLSGIAKMADIIVVAVGQAAFLQKEWIKPGATVIDVGINEVRGGVANTRKICGDVDYEAVLAIAGAISPVPGGVGPLTVAMLVKNVFEAFKLNTSHSI